MSRYDERSTWKGGKQEYAPFSTQDSWQGEEGDMLSYAYSNCVWINVIKPFEATLEYEDYERGRSACTFWWRDIETGIGYPMFVGFMNDLLLSEKIQGKQVTGKWKVRKKGANYGIEYLGE